MKVEVRLFALLDRYLPPGAAGDGASLDVPAGTTVRDVVESLRIPSELSCLTFITETLGHDMHPTVVPS